MEALVEKRSCLLTQAEKDLQHSIEAMEEAKRSLMVAKEQLVHVKAAKEKEDLLISAKKIDAQLPDNRQSVEKMKDLLCLLPVEKASCFGECLSLLEGLLKSASSPVVQVVPDSDSEMGQPIEVPVFPSYPSAADVITDPYTDVESPSTPGRRRTRSESPRRSPGARSRTSSGRRLNFKQSEHMSATIQLFSRREGAPISQLGEMP